jgi:hypothetical protein
MEAALTPEDWTLDEARRAPLAWAASVNNCGDVSDDPNRFRLPAQVPAESQQPWELFFCRK